MLLFQTTPSSYSHFPRPKCLEMVCSHLNFIDNDEMIVHSLSPSKSSTILFSPCPPILPASMATEQSDQWAPRKFHLMDQTSYFFLWHNLYHFSIHCISEKLDSLCKVYVLQSSHKCWRHSLLPAVPQKTCLQSLLLRRLRQEDYSLMVKQGRSVPFSKHKIRTGGYCSMVEH